MKYINNLKNNILAKKEPGKVEYAILLLLIAASFFTMYYTDISITYQHGLILISSILDGRFFDFYDYAVKLSSFGNIGYAVYEIAIYIVFAIWNIPVYIAIHIFGVDTFAMGCMLWNKLLVLICMGISGFGMYKIGQALKFENGKSKWLAFFFLSSMATFLPVVQLAQYDIIYMVPLLFGLYYYLKDDYKKFMILSAIAVPMKILPLFIIIPLILLKQKKVIFIVRDILVVCSLWFTCKIVFIWSSAYQHALSYANSNIVARFSSNIRIGGFEASLFIIVYMVICAWAYAYEKDMKDYKLYTTFICFASIGTFFCFSLTASYWIVILIPFLLIFIFNNADQFIAFVLEHVFILSYLFINIIVSPHTFGNEITFDYLLLKKYVTHANSIGAFITERGIGEYSSLINGMLGGTFIVLIMLFYPREKRSSMPVMKNGYLYFSWLRLGMIALWILLQIKVIF